MLRILLATDSEILRPRLRLIIAETLHPELILEVVERHQVVEEVRLACPGLVILFFPKLGRSAMQLVPAIRSIQPTTVIIALTNLFSQIDEDAWRKAGATYVFDLESRLEQFIECLSALAQAESAHHRQQAGDKGPNIEPQ